MSCAFLGTSIIGKSHLTLPQYEIFGRKAYSCRLWASLGAKARIFLLPGLKQGVMIMP